MWCSGVEARAHGWEAPLMFIYAVGFFSLEYALTSPNLILKVPCPEIIWCLGNGFSKLTILQIKT